MRLSENTPSPGENIKDMNLSDTRPRAKRSDVYAVNGQEWMQRQLLSCSESFTQTSARSKSLSSVGV